MATTSSGPTDILAYLHEQEHKSLLRFITCGSVDDGKSSLIGRLLYESQMIFDDQLAAVEADSRTSGTQNGELDLALVMDGLAAEREQGITIDVAYRYFSTDKRKFIVADTPGHEQYTRNMVTGASTADCAVILIDSRKGILRQTRRHSYIVSLLGIRHVALAVNKMDLVDYSHDRFRELESDYRALAAELSLFDVACIPVSALRGDNVLNASEQMPWYGGPTLMHWLDNVEIDEQRMQDAPFRMPVQWVNRPNLDFRGLAGTIVGGSVKVGDPVRVLPGSTESRIAQIVTYDGTPESAVAGQSVTLVLADDVDVSRGDMLAQPAKPAGVGSQFEATLVWMAEEPMLPGRDYLMRVGTQLATATITPLKHVINVESFREDVAATKLELNEIGVVELELDRRIAFDPYKENRETGGFVLIDRITNNTVGAGLLSFALRRSENVRWQDIDVGKAERARIKSQRPCLIWLTGLSGAGKSTIANIVERELHRAGRHTYILDGDNVRHGLSKDLGFTDTDRVENVRRVGEVGKLFVDAGLIVVACFISPFRSEREMVRDLMEDGEFIEVFVDAPLEVAESRDTKDLYRKARCGELTNLTGVDSPYEPPSAAELRVDTSRCTPEEAAQRLLDLLSDGGYLSLGPDET